MLRAVLGFFLSLMLLVLGMINALALVKFNAPQPLTLHTAESGRVTSRVWLQGTNVVRTKTHKWDGRGRLLGVSERDANSSGYDWSALYDGFNRRVLTKTVFWTNGVSLAGQPTVMQQYYDPEVEFLEVGVSLNGKTTWKLYGPDASGTYGGLGGVGGLDAIAPPPDLFCPLVSDIRGNMQAIYDQRHQSLTWNKSRVTGYGAVPGHRPVPLGQSADLAMAAAWRGSWSDVTGYYWLGMRYYDPVAGRWLSDDSLGHSADPALQTFCGGDPINRFDPDGRWGKTALDYGGNAIMGFAEVWTGYDPGQPTTETGYYGRVGGRETGGALASFLTVKGGGDIIGGGFLMAGSGALEFGSGGALTIVAAPAFGAGARQALWGTAELSAGAWGLHNFNKLEPLDNPSAPKGGLHPEAGPYKDPTPREYQGGFNPDQLVKDHLDSRAHGGLDVSDNIDFKPWQPNAIKGGREGQLLRYEQYLRDHGMSEPDIKKVTAGEWKSIRNDVHATSTDPSKFDKMAAP